MSQVGRKHGRGADRVIADAKAFIGAECAAVRQREIDALPTVDWKGRTLYTLICCGTSGKGSHIVNVPLAMVWHLISLRRYFCPYHAGDALSEMTACSRSRYVRVVVIRLVSTATMTRSAFRRIRNRVHYRAR